MNVIQVQKMSWREFEEKGEDILKKLQDSLLPEHADEFVAINVETGEYMLGKDWSALGFEFRRRFPDQVAFVQRVDGGPVIKFYDRNSL